MTAPQHATDRRWYIASLDWCIDRLATLAARLDRPASDIRREPATIPPPALGADPYAACRAYGITSGVPLVRPYVRVGSAAEWLWLRELEASR